jgi:hypothetical protein
MKRTSNTAFSDSEVCLSNGGPAARPAARPAATAAAEAASASAEAAEVVPSHRRRGGGLQVDSEALAAAATEARILQPGGGAGG